MWFSIYFLHSIIKLFFDFFSINLETHTNTLIYLFREKENDVESKKNEQKGRRGRDDIYEKHTTIPYQSYQSSSLFLSFIDITFSIKDKAYSALGEIQH